MFMLFLLGELTSNGLKSLFRFAARWGGGGGGGGGVDICSG